jgi:tetratricopeptide (TPR) repeat protein
MRSLMAVLAILAALGVGGCATPTQEANTLLVKAAPEIESGSDVPDGVALARKATEADPTAPGGWYWLGYGLFIQKNYADAASALRKALDTGAVSDQYWSAVYVLGQCYARTSDKAAFQKLVESAANVQAKTAPSLNSKGQLFLSAAMIGPAIQSFMGALILVPGNSVYSQNVAAAVQEIDPIYGAAYRAHPSFKMLLFSQESAVEVGRWRNRTLVEAKDTLLPTVLRDSKSEELEELATKIEQAILDLTHETEMATDRAQRADANLPGSGELQREFALVYRERIALLKPILASVREEISNRQK